MLEELSSNRKFMFGVFVASVLFTIIFVICFFATDSGGTKVFCFLMLLVCGFGFYLSHKVVSKYFHDLQESQKGEEKPVSPLVVPNTYPDMLKPAINETPIYTPPSQPQQQPQSQQFQQPYPQQPQSQQFQQTGMNPSISPAAQAAYDSVASQKSQQPQQPSSEFTVVYGPTVGVASTAATPVSVASQVAPPAGPPVGLAPPAFTNP